MKNALLLTMARDLQIKPYSNESDKSFISRLIYSALGLWCLRTAKNKNEEKFGTSKHNQTIVLNDLLSRYREMFPFIDDYFSDRGVYQTSIPVHIRKIYEETGYLLTNDSNYNELANFGRGINFAKDFLYFGIPTKISFMSGLGIFACDSDYSISVKDFLVRDSLTCREYLESKYNFIDFYTKDIDVANLEFFNPRLKCSPSQSWSEQLNTNMSVARNKNLGVYYRVLNDTDAIMFSDEPLNVEYDAFTSYDFRRLYFSLKMYYGSAVKAIITKVDNDYSFIRLGGHLPNRELYLLLLLSWPKNNVYDKINFVIQNRFISIVTNFLENIGVVVVGGN